MDILGDRRGKLPIMIIAIVGVVLLLGGIGVFVMKPKGTPEKKGEIKGPVVSLALGEFLVNLADTGQMRYLKADIVLEVKGEMAAAGGGHGGHGGGGGTDPKVRDAVIQVLSSKHMADLAGAEGKDKLKEDIIASVNSRLEKAKVVEVYFNEFAMQ